MCCLLSKKRNIGVKNKINKPMMPIAPCSASILEISLWDTALNPFILFSLYSTPLPTPIPKTGLSKKALIYYVVNLEIKSTSSIIKRSIINYGSICNITVYRGQSEEQTTINPNYWFSTTHLFDIAKNEFGNNVFIIHLNDVIALEVNKYVFEDIGTKSEEEEIIVQGEGVFYSNSTLSEKGFSKIEDNLYETWYVV